MTAKTKAVSLLGIPAAFLFLVALASWLRDGGPSESVPRSRMRTEKPLSAAASEPDPGPPAESRSSGRETAKPTAAPSFPVAPQQPAPAPMPANPWRPGYMGLDGIDVPG